MTEEPTRSRGRRRLVLAALALAIVATVTACRPWQPASGTSQGEELYRRNCVTCHGINGGGADGPSLIARRHTQDEIVAKVTTGAAGMPAFDQRLSPAEITAVAEYAASLSRGS